MNRTRLRILQALMLVGLFVVWQVLTQPGLIPPFMWDNPNRAAFFFGEPVKMFQVVWAWFSSGEIYPHLWVTLQETALAFVIGAALGLVIGLWLGLSPTASALFDPYITAMNAMPRVVLAPIFMVWFQVYDRRSQSEEATQSITAGWGGPQAITGPVLVIPYRASATETVVEGGQSVTRSRDVTRELTLAPETADLSTELRPQIRKRSIYEAVVYDAAIRGSAAFSFPRDLNRIGVDPAQMDLTRAELRFGISDPRGIGAAPRVSVNGQQLRLQPGSGSSGGRGFFAWVDASALATR